MEKDKQTLKRTMSSRHIMMMALGGAIGAGLFKGDETAIDEAGPSVLAGLPPRRNHSAVYYAGAGRNGSQKQTCKDVP